MHYMLAVRLNEATHDPSDEMFTNVGRVNDEMKATGCWVFAGGLLPSDSSTVVRVQDGATTVTDGPFAETKEQVAGFWVIDVDDLDGALAWAKKCTVACEVPIEVRPFDGLA